MADTADLVASGSSSQDAAIRVQRRLTRKQILDKKKSMEQLITSAYASHKDHLHPFPHFCFFRSNGLSLYLESGRGNKLSPPLKQCIQKLLKVNMENPYGSEWLVEEKVKRREMVAPDALYIMLYEDKSVYAEQLSTQTLNENDPIAGFVQYRFIIEEEVPVLYLYELQLQPHLQGKGVGKFLMQLIELIACKNSMSAVVLTVQKENRSAMNFYLNKLRYTISSISPSRVDPLFGKEKSYEILCKVFDHEAKAILQEKCEFWCYNTLKV